MTPLPAQLHPRAIWRAMIARSGDKGHLRELDGVRALSILLVLAAHLLPLGPAFLGLNNSAGILGMSLFFCLSGFLITSVLWRRPEIRPFLIRRGARIVPLMYLYGAIVTLVVTWRPDTLLAILTFTLNYSDPQIFKGVSHLWSLCVEVHFYIAIALVVGLFGRRGFWLVPVAAVLVTANRISLNDVASIRTHLRVDEILSGSLLALWWLNRNHPWLARPGAWLPRLLPVTFPLWLLSAHEAFLPLPYARPYLALALVGGIMQLATGNRIRRVLEQDVLAYIARISYALYIWHPLTALGVMNTGSSAVRYLIKRPVSFALTFLLAHLSTFRYEQVFTDWAKRMTTPKDRS